jgi:hypothetical protein
LRNNTNLPNILQNNFTVELATDLYNFAKQEKFDKKKSLTKWMAILCRIDENSISATATISKIYRCINVLKGKRGEDQHLYLGSIFNIPTSPADSSHNCSFRDKSMKLSGFPLW